MKILTITMIVILAFTSSIVYAPNYLFYNDSPRRSDAIILFLGNEFKERRMEVRKLIEDGYASYLIIPAYDRVVEAEKHHEASRGAVPSRPPSYPSYYEDTHIEIIEAKRIMDKKGLNSAIFVSSPHHMRRIRIITAKVFQKGFYQVTFVPTRFEKRKNGLWFLNESEVKKVTGEYLKIGWFFLYYALQ